MINGKHDIPMASQISARAAVPVPVSTEAVAHDDGNQRFLLNLQSILRHSVAEEIRCQITIFYSVHHYEIQEPKHESWQMILSAVRYASFS